MADTRYPIDSLGGMYVHTNYKHFANTVGSFGGYSGDLLNEAHKRITDQLQRETELEKSLQEAFGSEFTLDTFLKEISKTSQKIRNSIIDKAVKEKSKTAGLSPEEVNALSNFNITSILHSQKNLEVNKEVLQNMINELQDRVNTMGAEGYINLQSFSSEMSKMNTQFNSLINKIDQKSEKIAQDNVWQAFGGTMGNLKGSYEEVFKGLTILETFKTIHGGLRGLKKHGFEVVGVGAGGSPGADIKVKFDNYHFGINIKSTSYETFKQHHVTLFSPKTLNNLINHIEDFAGSSNIIEAFKYYLINISRMRFSEMTDQGSQKGGLSAIPEGRELVRNVLRTYTTLFIGEQGGRASELPTDFREADFLFLRDKGYRKSEILQRVFQENLGVEGAGGMSSLLEIKYQDTYDSWDAFDIIKVHSMINSGGSYEGVVGMPFVVKAAESILKQQAWIKLTMHKVLSK